MASQTAALTGVERFFGEDEILVTKTDLKGRLTYVNSVCMKVCGFKEREMIGEQHNIIRHPDMPRCIFKLLWDTLGSGKEIFAYVVNRSKNGDHYWVFAHVTPSFDASGNITGYHSNRRVPDRSILDETIIPLYKTLLDEESKHENKKEGMSSSFGMLSNILKEKGIGYDEFIFSL